MIDAMQQQGAEIEAGLLIGAYKERLNNLQELTIVLKAYSEAQSRQIAALNEKIGGMAAQMEANQSEITRLAEMVTALGGEPFPSPPEE